MTEQVNQKQFSLEEVKQHNKEQDCWIIIGDKVLDVTKFLNLHPAGKNILLQYAGKDATDIFKYFHNSEFVLNKYKKLIIGTFKDYQQKEIAAILQFNNTSGEGIPFGDPNYIQGWNSLYYNDTHKQLRAAVKEFTKKYIEPFVEEWEENQQVPVEIRKKCAEVGLLALCIGQPWPDKWANKFVLGVELKNPDSFHEFIMRDEMARIGSIGVFRGLMGGTGIGLPPVLKFGSEELQQRIIPPCMIGEKSICLVITEPWAGSDVANIQCKAVLNSSKTHYIVNGMKKWITNGGYCEYLTTAVRTGEKGMNGISLLLIESQFKGVKTRKIKCSGDQAAGTAFIILEDVEVPVKNLIGKEGQGFQQIMINFNHERLIMCQYGMRLARTCLEESMKFSHQRKTFGKRLIDHPVIRNKIGNMACKVEALQAYIEVCCYNFDKMNQKTQNQLLSGGFALLKVQTTQTIEFCSREAIQIFGGLGYTKGGLGSKVERIYREAKSMAIPGGSEEILLDLGIRQSSKLMPKF